jgi:polyisoprenoid-binding protein YceI
MKNILRLLPLLIIQLSFAQNKDFKITEYYPIEKSHSFISFSVTYMGYAKVRGNFENFSGTFRYDPKDLKKTSVSFLINTGSIDTNLKFRDNDLKSEDWLDAEKYPIISFVSNGIQITQDGFEVKGVLTIKEISKQVSLRMDRPSGILKDVRGDLQVIMTGSVEIDRTHFGVEGERWSKIKEGIVGVSDIIEIEFSMLGKQIQLENQLSRWSNESMPPGKLLASHKKGGMKTLIETFEQINKETALEPWALNSVGYMLLKQGNLSEALKIFILNKDQFPEDSNAYGAIGETYALLGDFKNSKAYYEKSLQLNKENMHAAEILRYLK